MQNQIVIGLGQIGTAIRNILKCDGYDFRDSETEGLRQYDVIHICFPFTNQFVQRVEEYVGKYKPSLVIVHSTVPIGTCDPHGWVHSPVRGVHPNLELGIKTFVKYFGGKRAFEAANIFASKGIKVRIIDAARHTEAAKLWDTTQYGAMILLEKEIHQYCIDNDVDFETVYASFNETYNAGYYILGMPHVARPSLVHMDGPIGGHCVIPNCRLLDSPTPKKIIDENCKF